MVDQERVPDLLDLRAIWVATEVRHDVLVLIVEIIHLILSWGSRMDDYLILGIRENDGDLRGSRAHQAGIGQWDQNELEEDCPDAEDLVICEEAVEGHVEPGRLYIGVEPGRQDEEGGPGVEDLRSHHQGSRVRLERAHERGVEHIDRGVHEWCTQKSRGSTLQFFLRGYALQGPGGRDWPIDSTLSLVGPEALIGVGVLAKDAGIFHIGDAETDEALLQIRDDIVVHLD